MATSSFTFKLLLTSLTNSILPSILNPFMNLLNAEIYNLPHLLNAEIYNLPHLLNAETSTNPLNASTRQILEPIRPPSIFLRVFNFTALTQPLPHHAHSIKIIVTLPGMCTHSTK